MVRIARDKSSSERISIDAIGKSETKIQGPYEVIVEEKNCLIKKRKRRTSILFWLGTDDRKSEI